MLLLSAESRTSMDRARAALADGLAGEEDVNIADVAFTLASRRKDMTRMAAVVHDRRQAVTVLRDPEHENIFVGEAAAAIESPSDRVVFVFPGQGAQYAGMALGLYETEPVFTHHFDRCAAGFLDELGIDLRTEIFNGAGSGLERTDRAQSALFTVEYALAKLLEFTASARRHCVATASANSLRPRWRGSSISRQPSARCRCAPASCTHRLQAQCSRCRWVLTPSPNTFPATSTLPRSMITGAAFVAGTKEGIRAFAGQLSRKGLTVRRVRTAHGFHSRSMDSVLPEFDGLLSTFPLRKPEIPLLSNVTGTWLTDDEATTHSIWTRQVRATVRFADELDAILVDRSRVLVEVGPVEASRRRPFVTTDGRTGIVPSGSCGTPLRTETIATSFCSGSGNSGRPTSTSTGPLFCPDADRGQSRYRGIRHHERNIGLSLPKMLPPKSVSTTSPTSNRHCRGSLRSVWACALSMWTPTSSTSAPTR